MNTQAPETFMKTPQSFIEKFVPTTRDGRAADLGCGDGQLAVILASLGYMVDAVDYDTTWLDILQEFAEEHNFPINTRNLRIENFHESIPDQSLDVVTALNVLHYPDQSGNLLFESQISEIARVLKKGGRFICSIKKLTQEGENRLSALKGGLRITNDFLNSLWQPLFDKVYFDPERQYAGPPSNDEQACHWDLVADKR